MLTYQILNPTDKYSSIIEPSETYIIIDPISVEDHTNDDLSFALNKKNISKANKIFIFNGYLYLKEYHEQAVYAPEFILENCDQYLNHFPNYELNFNKTVPFNYQMYSLRFTRAIASCYLKNTFYQKVDFIYSQPWELNQDFLSFTKSFFYSNNLDFNAESLPSKYFDVPGTHYNSLKVFDSALKENMFDPCAISIAHEPVETDCGAIISEKFINAVYGANIPIILGYKIYDVLDKIGFDTFSDIIDTSSQYVEDPHLRVVSMLDSNKHILNKEALLLFKDKKIHDRLKHNFHMLRDIPKLRHAMSKLNLPDMQEKTLDLISKDARLTRMFHYFIGKN